MGNGRYQIGRWFLLSPLRAPLTVDTPASRWTEFAEDALKMAMNVRCAGGYCEGSDPVLKSPLNMMCRQQQVPPFQAMPPSQPLGPPMVMSPDLLPFSLSAPLSAKSPPYLQLVQRPPAPAVPPPSPKPQEEECQAGGVEQDATLEELCKPLYCKLCNVTLNSAQQAQAHYQGKNHSKKLRNFYAGSQQPPAIRIPEVVEPVSLQPFANTPAENSTACKQGARVILATENDYCKLCDASFSSPAVAQAHYQGKNHAKRLRLAEAQQSAPFQDSMESSQRRQRKEGSEFKMIKNRRNVHVPPSVPGPYYRPRQRIPRDLAMCVTPSGQFYCSMCNSGAGEEADFRLHLESKQHKSKVSEQRYRSEMEHLGYT
ncbi:zinc finger matrin-type protein 3 isoform X1 [Scleropages formosus]|uniref:Zinc finger matrin-type protein 3 n=2 Tax=Scleropages formosus TaxID=113540 RepID=A0A8C9R7F8_SCLFO|nr:zinc finger matrin-type protein 3 isoform X1 [Scleropages formosus]XP_018612785.1 zinc finger matrin-type protein 3 isoform X1 [Scleropages formosus]XP_018612786.1 zinc finger matrin-type protein 3 isoform X1 [Scleropages formosus]